jgi:1,4-dihydroxy-2-naphthoate octaprenyltransferase
VAVGYYLQTGRIVPTVHWLAIPIGLTIFNVILINEYPDWAADSLADKRNITVRLGRERAAWLYALVSAGSWAGMLLSINHGVPTRTLLFYAPAWVISSMSVGGVLAGHWRDPVKLERLCAATLLTNLATSAAYILAFWP